MGSPRGAMHGRTTVGIFVCCLLQRFVDAVFSKISQLL